MYADDCEVGVLVEAYEFSSSSFLQKNARIPLATDKWQVKLYIREIIITKYGIQ